MKASKLLVGYLFQWFKNNAQMIQAQGTGATVQGVKLPFIKSLIIPIPPIKEQQRIVAILDQAFDAIATAKATAEKNLKNAREIFESHLNAVFSQRGEGWVETNLGKEIDLLTGFAFKSKEYTDAADGIKLLRGDNIIQGIFRWEEVKRWPKSDADTYANVSLAENDIVLAMDRTWVKMEKSDIFDVLAHVAFALPPLRREDRACFLRWFRREKKSWHPESKKQKQATSKSP